MSPRAIRDIGCIGRSRLKGGKSVYKAGSKRHSLGWLTNYMKKIPKITIRAIEHNKTMSATGEMILDEV